MTEESSHLGIIAGNRSLPLELAKLARKAGVSKLHAVAFEGETDPDLARSVDEITWLKVGQLSKLINSLKQNGIKQCVMAGQITPRSLFDIRPDLRATALLFRLKEKNAHSIFGAIGEELKKEGIDLVAATPWLREIMPSTGFRIGRQLSRELQEDIQFGLNIAKEVSRLEIGQTSVVKRGTVLAVEGFEGTDRCLTRGGELAGKKGGAVAIKVAKKDHDMRFDIPCIGVQTIHTCLEAKIRVLAVEADKVILLERDAVNALVAKADFSLVTC